MKSDDVFWDTFKNKNCSSLTVEGEQMQHAQKRNLHADHNNRMTRTTERRKNRGYFIPTLYLFLEVLIGYLLLYIVHAGKAVTDWNPIYVGVVVLYLIVSSLPRYIKILKRTRTMRRSQRMGHNHRIGHIHPL
jgi:hypothetical protein